MTKPINFKTKFISKTKVVCIDCKNKVIRTSNNMVRCASCRKKKNYRPKLTDKQKNKICDICKEPYIAKRINQKICYRDECRESYYKNTYKKHYLSKKERDKKRAFWT